VPKCLPSTILFAGGGTGGHLFPSLAIVERLREQNIPCVSHFLISTRTLDQQILERLDETYTALPVRPMPVCAQDIMAIPRFVCAWFASVGEVRRLINQKNVTAVVAMGGYVSAPAIKAAYQVGKPVALVNLDSPAGRANRWMARWASDVFSVGQGLSGSREIGFPLRRSAVGIGKTSEACCTLGLDPKRSTLLVAGGSQGAQSINQMMVQLVDSPAVLETLASWQVLHLTGQHPVEPIRDAYARNNIHAKVEPFCDQMGLAWQAADLAISRAGAGSVAEAWANATPVLFLPYPHHKDNHQSHNARRLEKIGGAKAYQDLIDPKVNATHLSDPLMTLMKDQGQREGMKMAMQAQKPEDGAVTVAAWIAKKIEQTLNPKP